MAKAKVDYLIQKASHHWGNQGPQSLHLTEVNAQIERDADLGETGNTEAGGIRGLHPSDTCGLAYDAALDGPSSAP